MNKKLRALCKSLKKNKPAPPTAQAQPETKQEESAPLLKKVQKQNANDNDTANYKRENLPGYQISEAERRRRMISDLRSRTESTHNLTPYEIALKEAEREEEKKRQEALLQQQKKDLEQLNSYRLDKNVFNILTIFKSQNGFLSNPKILRNFEKTFKFDAQKVMSVNPAQEEEAKQASKITQADYKRCMKEFKNWVEESNSELKKRHQKYLTKSAISKSLQFHTSGSDSKEDTSILLKDYQYPCLFRNSRLNLEKKNELTEAIKKCEDEHKHLSIDICKVNEALKSKRVQKADFLAQKLINELDLKISGEILNFHQQDHMERKKRKAEAKAKLQETLNP
ncbi:unnamed protein product [Moneuplotes crassus]|uniref:Uncharacterized protein n=1 Tax=Euplotes crassus TaxID=5936 RepID=A0AAD1U4K4_EUPCR|nr:unnamed protein product [Moneuplotes crassus]